MKQVNVDVTQKFNNSKVPKNLGVLPQASGEQSQGRLFVDINGKSYFITLEQLITLAQKGGGGGTVDLSEYQKKTDETLETESKEVVGAINEVNGKTVDKIIYLNFQSGNNGIFSCNEEGIGYENEYEIETVDGDYHYGSVDNRIPLVAGENVTFEIDEANQVVKINATGGSATDDSVVGTWVFKDEIDVSTDMYLDYAYYFNGSESVGISIHYNQLDLFDNDEGDYITVYSNGKWKDEKYKILEIIGIGDNHNGDDTWLKANATKQGEETPSKPCFEMPQIRFVGAKYFFPDKVVNASQPLTLTIEIVGGGALQVDDKLQICARRTSWKKDWHGNHQPKSKLRCQQYYTITAEDLNKQFLTITTDGDKWLFKDERAGRMNDRVNHLSPFYLRIKRATKYSEYGNECDAIFSNVVTVWKTYDYLHGSVKIK